MSGLLTFVSVCGIITSLLLILAPLPAYIKAWRTKNTAGLSVEYILASNVSQIAWGLYGMKESAMAILLPSGVGVVLTFGYLVVYEALLGPVLGFITAYLTTGIVAVAVLYRVLSVSQLGLSCLLLSVANCLSALFQPVHAYQRRDPTLIDLNISLALLLCGLSWTGYGLLTQDPFVLIPNLLCQFVALVNITVWGILDESGLVQIWWVRIRSLWKESKLKKQAEGYFWV